MPSTDARVYIELSNRRIPFSYRYFNTFEPYIAQLLPGWAPEFTLRDYKIVIVVKGTFFGQIPGVLIKDVLASVILQQAGWKFYTFHEFDIVNNVGKLVDTIPELRRPVKTGGIYHNPFGTPQIMEQYRLLRLRQRRYIVSNALVSSRAATGRRRNRRGGAHLVRRKYRDLSREQPRTRGPRFIG